MTLLALPGCWSSNDACPFSKPTPPPTPAKLVIVIEENHGYSKIIGNADAPYINHLATYANFTNSYAITHPSQPNYIALFSGSTQGVLTDGVYPHELFCAPNLGAKLLAAGLTFGGYSEGLPETGSDIETAGDNATGTYRRKHNPWVNWQDATTPLPPNKLPPSVNMPFTAFPRDYALLPNVSIVVPNQKHDMHDGTVAEADLWLQQNIGPYVDWAQQNDSLLILTWDEDDGPELNHIVTLMVGPMVIPGAYDGFINHFSVLHMIEEMYTLAHDAGTLLTLPVPGTVWRSSP